MLRGRALALGLALIALARPARAFDVPPSAAQPDFPFRAKEFCVARHGTTFHLFYTRDDTTAPFDSSTKSLGHMVSPDLIHWTEEPVTLPVRADKWDNSHVWAPHIVTTDSLYYLFYAGVTKIEGQVEDMQQIGLATSTDLENWTRLDAPVFTCAQAPWTYCDPSVALGGNLRDPFVIPDPDSLGRWLLLYGAMQDPSTGQMMIGVATSSGDFTQWSDHGPILSTNWPTTFSRLEESPLALQHDGLWYLFFTTDSGHPVNYETTPDLLAPFEQWSQQYRLEAQIPGTDDTYGPEGFIVGSQTFFGLADESTGAALMWEIVFDTPPNFHVVTPAVVGVTPARGDDALALTAAPRLDRDGGMRLTVTSPAETRARLTVYDLQGRAVGRLLDGPLARGTRAFTWRAGLGSGVYFARLDTPLGRRTARFALAH